MNKHFKKVVTNSITPKEERSTPACRSHLSKNSETICSQIQETQQKWSAKLAGKNVYLACSGGVDSLVLAHLLKDLCSKLTLIHVNYHLRGEDSNRDEQFVRSFGKQHQIEVQVNSVDYTSEHPDRKINIQLAARDTRYTWFKQIQGLDPDNLIALAHHLDDQIETFYLNLARKSGLLGMTVMHPNMHSYIRPLLDWTKEEIYEYARLNQIEWGEDYSNAESKYARNKLRNIILPELYQAIPDLRESIQILVKQLQVVRENYTIKAQQLLKEYKRKTHTAIPKQVFRELSEDFRSVLLEQLHVPIPNITALETLLNRSNGKQLLTKAQTFIVQDDELLIYPTTPTSSQATLKMENVDILPQQFSQEVIYLDSTKIQGSLFLRPWVKGDRMRIQGTQGSKLISHILKDAKVPLPERDSVLVLCDSQNILACYGYRVSPLALANDESPEKIKVWVEK